MSDMRYDGKVAVVTGAGQGLGRSHAMFLASRGAKVVVNDLGGSTDGSGASQTPAQKVCDEIKAAGGTAVANYDSVSSEAGARAIIDAAVKAYGRIDILVNNAGSLAGSDAFMATTPESWEASFQVNLLGPMRLSQAVIPHMQRQGGGSIVNIGSTGSLGAEPGFGAYTAMKHGLVGLSKTIAAEFGPDGIRCNTVCPGYIATDMHMAANARLATAAGVELDEIKARRYANVALRDAGMPEDVAEAVAFLVGPSGRYVTGINLPLAGGVPAGI